MMTFPGLSEKQIADFGERESRLENSFLASPPVKHLMGDRQDLDRLNTLFAQYRHSLQQSDDTALTELEKSPLFPLARTAVSIQTGRNSATIPDKEPLAAAREYLQLRKGLHDIAAQKQQAMLNRTIAGWMGQGLETVTRPLGFDSRINIALVGGFAAKEVIVSTLGTAYSLGETDPAEAGFLPQRLKNDPRWNPLLAVTLLIFTMLYVPCFATVIVIKKESSWLWAMFSIGFNLLVAYTIALFISQGGRLLNLGL
jgi:ferrous iron transport protein B